MGLPGLWQPRQHADKPFDQRTLNGSSRSGCGQSFSHRLRENRIRMQHESRDSLINHRLLTGDEVKQQHDATLRRKARQKGIHVLIDVKWILSGCEQGKEAGVMTAADWINIALTFFTALMAAATFCLARHTRNLAKDTAEGIKQADRHHQEDLRPFCVIDFKHRTDQDPFGLDWNSNLRLTEAQKSGAESPPPAGTIAIRGQLRNNGKGLAKGVVVYLNKRLGPGEERYRLTRPVVVSGLIGAEEAVKIDVLEPPELLTVLRKVEKRGALEIAKRLRQTVGQIFRYGIVTGRANRDPSVDLKGALKASGRQAHHIIRPILARCLVLPAATDTDSKAKRPIRRENLDSAASPRRCRATMAKRIL
jgi:hypothetical protein